MVAHRRETLADDLISELIWAEDDGDRLTSDELQMLASTILMAGTDTTRNQVAAAVEVFCDHLDQWELLAERPELAMTAVEEVMRYSPVIFGAMRIRVEDVELEGMIIPAGTFVTVNTAAANRDPAMYDDPDRREPCQTRTRRGLDRHGAPDAESALHRTRPVETDSRHHRPNEPAHRIRRCLTGP